MTISEEIISLKDRPYQKRHRAKQHAQTLNEELEYLESKSKNGERDRGRISFIESELNKLKKAGLI